jgi:AraC-like DNA-binding protein
MEFERSDIRRAAAQRSPADSAARVGTSLAIPNVLRSLGLDPEEVLGEIGYDLKLFDSPENRISLQAHHHIVNHCTTRSGCPHFGLLVGQQNGLHSLGLVGLLVKYSSDVGAALRNVARYMHIHASGRTMTLVVDGSTAMFTYEVQDSRLEAIDQVGDAAVATMHNIMRELCGTDWRPAEAWFAHREPTETGPYRRFFRVPLRFNAEQFALLFSSSYLKRRPSVVDVDLRRVLQEQIDLLEERYREDFPQRVRDVLHSALMTGHANADEVAALFGMHSRTLNRQLNAFGIGFQQLVDESRFEIARQMLENSTMEVGLIAQLLDYAAPSVFTRAFRRWSGTTPVKWRAAHKGAS